MGRERTIVKEPHIVITGNPVDGFTYLGPFETRDDACDYADDRCETDWWIAPLNEVLIP